MYWFRSLRELNLYRFNIGTEINIYGHYSNIQDEMWHQCKGAYQLRKMSSKK